jgi:hypothetical protein
MEPETTSQTLPINTQIAQSSYPIYLPSRFPRLGFVDTPYLVFLNKQATGSRAADLTATQRSSISDAWFQIAIR